MPGGLLNLVANGNMNLILNGNPSKTFFKTSYTKYTNFGLQRFRIDYQDLNVLRLSEDSTFEFRVQAYADLLMDTYLSVRLPDIWSPIYQEEGENTTLCQPYEFKWIENLGAQLIRRVRYLINGRVIQEFTGQYLYSMVQRDFSEDKKALFDKLIGNVPELNDPANYSNRNGNYPNASYNGYTNSDWPNGVEPSIRSKTLYIPLNIGPTLLSQMAFPIASLHYNHLHIQVECRPIQDLFVVRDIDYFIEHKLDHLTNPYSIYNAPYIRPDFTDPKYQMYYFINEPVSGAVVVHGIEEESDNYSNIDGTWFSDIHLSSTYAFLDKEEIRVFAAKPQKYLIKEIYEDIKYNITDVQRVNINSKGLVVSWMWFFQRSDVILRNEWSNYTNWEYKDSQFPCILSYDISTNPNPLSYPKPCLPPCPLTYNYCDMYITGPLHIENQRDIMRNWGLIIDEKVRETMLPEGVVNLVEKYVRTAGNGKPGLYCYNFCINTNPLIHQPSGAINLSKFNKVEFEVTTIQPYKVSMTPTRCNIDGDIIGENDPDWKDYEYSFNFHIMEERYNILNFDSGMATLMFGR
jgi:hypothetical protein